MKKKQIKINENPNYEIIGIVSAEKQHRLAWFLNNNLNLKLVQTAEIKTEAKTTGHEIVFPVFECFNPETETLFRLIGNKTDSKTLIAKQKDFDYFLTFSSVIYKTSELIYQLRQFNFIIAAYPIDKESISPKNKNLFF